MMKSVALADSSYHEKEEDFVLIDVDDAGEETEQFGDESYDYCDDVVSLHSASQTFALDSRALQSFQDDFFENRLDPAIFNVEEDLSDEIQILLDGIAPMMTARETFSHKDDEDSPPDLSAVSERSLAEAEAEEESLSSKNLGGESPNVSDVPSLDPASADDREDLESTTSTQSTRSTHGGMTSDETSSQPRSTGSEAAFDDDDDKVQRIADAISAGMMKTKSRTCNKKRRKQLKLAKKAAAAAAAAAAFSGLSSYHASSSRNDTTPRRKSSRKQLKPSKQITNIAVACATESLANFKQECLLNHSKKIK